MPLRQTVSRSGGDCTGRAIVGPGKDTLVKVRSKARPVCVIATQVVVSLRRMVPRGEKLDQNGSRKSLNIGLTAAPGCHIQVLDGRHCTAFAGCKDQDEDTGE